MQSTTQVEPAKALSESESPSGIGHSFPPLSTRVPKLTPDDIVREVRQLPSTPKILPRLKHLLSDTNSEIQEIVFLIRLDPGIAARVLQVGNSAYFNMGARCDTVEEAVSRVGFGHIYELVSFAVASQVLVRPLEVYSMPNDAAWRASVACAFSAEELAPFGGLEPNAAYTVGLLHWVGMVAINEWALRVRFPGKLTNRGFPVDASEDERAQFGFSQADVGAALLHEWVFPTSISEPVRYQYTPAAAPGYAKTASLLKVAKWIGATVCENRELAPPPTALLQSLRLSTASLDKISDSVSRRLVAVMALLDASRDSRSPLVQPDWVKFPTEQLKTPARR